MMAVSLGTVLSSRELITNDVQATPALGGNRQVAPEAELVETGEGLLVERGESSLVARSESLLITTKE